MLQKILQYCKQENLIEKKDYILAGVSGGADSVCMLLLLRELQKEMEFRLEVVHVEHGIRGAESEADAEFVKQLCDRFGIPLQLFHVRVIEYAKEQKLGLEEAARILRYDCYIQAAEKIRSFEEISNPIKISLAHHADDNAETVLFQMLRGSGIDGLSGMRPRRTLKEGVDMIRPMLPITRKEIELFLEEEKVSYCMDSTNEEVVYSRNKIRKVIFPILEEINAQAVAHINQSACMLREVSDYLRIQVQAASEILLIEQEEGLILQKEPWKTMPLVLQKEVCHLALAKVCGSAKDIGLEHVEALMGLMELQVGRGLDLPYKVEARRIYEGILLKKRKEQIQTEENDFCLDISEEALEEILQKSVFWEIPNGKIVFSLLLRQESDRCEVIEENVKISKNRYTKYFDYDKIKGGFQIRTRQAGDYLVIDEVGHKKRLKEYFINEKIPSEKRNQILLLTRGAKVFWVMGGRISADSKVSKDTKRILKVQIIGGTYYESESSP